jgi:16S rRNA (guanine527-N7)-methyltransferase
MDSEVRDRLLTRAAAARVEIPDLFCDRLLAYYALLVRWNRVVNLTSLDDLDAALDRLLIEPLAAATRLPPSAFLVDLGSGGGSPAIPLAIALSASELEMIESRTRKAAFLREVVRELGINARVEPARFDDVLRGRTLQSPAVISARAIRLGAAHFQTIAEALPEGSLVALFRTSSQRIPATEYPSTLREVGRYPLVPTNQSSLTLLSKISGGVPRGTVV